MFRLLPAFSIPWLFKNHFSKEISWDRIFWERRRKYFNKFMPFFMWMGMMKEGVVVVAGFSNHHLIWQIRFISLGILPCREKKWWEKRKLSRRRQKNTIFFVETSSLEEGTLFLLKENKHWCFLKWRCLSDRLFAEYLSLLVISLLVYLGWSKDYLIRYIICLSFALAFKNFIKSIETINCWNP